MAKKEQPSNVNNNINNNTNVINIRNPHPRKPNAEKEKKPNWFLKAIVVAVIGLVCTIITIYIKNSTAANGKPAFIQNGTPVITEDKK